MSNVILSMTISLDGFVNDRHGSVGSLYPDLAELRKSELLRESIKNTGAVVMGRHAYKMGHPDAYVDNYEYQVPIFVLAHDAPKKLPKQSERLTFTFVTDGIESAIAKAKAAAGDKDVTVIGGASTFQQSIKAGVVDEIQLDIMPVLLCKGLRLFEHLEDMETIQLEKIRVLESSIRTYMGFRVMKGKMTMAANKTNTQQENGFPKISAPALRALHGAGYLRLEQLSDVSEIEISKLHGMGPKALGVLKEALKAKGLNLK